MQLVGFSFSPGGLMLPWHLGVMSALQHQNVLLPSTPIAGSSAGAIAVAAQACGLDLEKDIMKATIAVSDACQVAGRARGNLLPFLEQELESRITEDVFEETFLNRPGITGIAYRELFPRNRKILQTEFTSQRDLLQAVLNSSHFPFFSTRWPVLVDSYNRVIPRIVVDGYFTVPRDRMGCPDFSMVQRKSARPAALSESTASKSTTDQTKKTLEDADNDTETVTTIAKSTSSDPSIVDRTIAVCCFPPKTIGFSAMTEQDYIAPPDVFDDNKESFYRYIRIATEATSDKELWEVYEEGYTAAEDWCRRERQRGLVQ